MFSLRHTPTKLIAGAATLAVFAGSATVVQAASAPTLSAPKVYNAGQKTPVEVAGNDLAAGDTIRKGTKLLRWKVTLNGRNNQTISLPATKGYKHVGLADQQRPPDQLRRREGLHLLQVHDQGSRLHAQGRRRGRRQRPHLRAGQEVRARQVAPALCGPSLPDWRRWPTSTPTTTASAPTATGAG